MLDSICSSEGWAFRKGEVVEIHPDLAQKWVAAGIAKYIEETAVAAAVAPERAVIRKRGR